MGDKRNIASELRRAHPYFFFKYMLSKKENSLGLNSFLPTFQEVYPEESERIDTRKGAWTIYSRYNFKIPYLIPRQQDSSNGFCAVYEQKDDLKTLFSGDLIPTNISLTQESIKKTIDVLTKEVLEQRKFISWPPRTLVEYNDAGFVLGPVGKAFIAGLGLCFVNELIALNLPEYKTLLERVNDYAGVNVLGTDFTFFATMSLIPLAFGASFITKKLKLGQRADKHRLKHLPEVAGEYKYGDEALDQIVDEAELFKTEQSKIKIYSELEKEGVNISKEFFTGVYNAFSSMDSMQFNHFVTAAKQGEELGVDFNRLINILSANIESKPL